MEMSTGVSLLRTAQSLLTGRTFFFLINGISTELWRLRIDCFTMPRKCRIQLRTLKQVPMSLIIRLALFYLLATEEIESNPRPQTGSTRDNISLRLWSWLQWQWKWTRFYQWCFCRYICTQSHWSEQPSRPALYLTSSIQITKLTLS